MQHQSIFANKYIKNKLSNFSLSDISDIETKQQKVSDWQVAIKKGSIRKTKEEALQADFLNTFFGEVLGYDFNRTGDKWHLEKEFKSVVDGSKADGALGYFSINEQDARAVIELKDAKTDLDRPQSRVDKRTPVEQAFGYANKAGGKCKWVIVSNFLEIRLYNSSDQSRYELFDILELLNEENLKKFFFLLQKNRLILENQKSAIDLFYEQRQAEEQVISDKFYKAYKAVRLELFDHLKKNNPKQSEILLFTKAQKILDRVIFICFCEDLTLIPKYTFRNIITNSKSTIDFSDNKLWMQVKNLFKAIDKGYPDASINKFNGGLFAEDKDLDNLVINDSVTEHIVELSKYDFESDLNVNILGHIFEQSISDIEEIKALITGEEFDDSKGKRKKDGIFYTPEHITRYIVNESVGEWLEDRKIELGFYNLPVLSENDLASIQLKTVIDKAQKRKINRLDYNKNVEKHILFWEAYRQKLSNIKVLDPACGSGAFLNQVFDYLHREGESVNAEMAKLKLGQREAFDLDKHILTNNIYGVDLNPESAEITKLSLWLKTANRHKELTALDDNIQCGNSLIDDSTVAKSNAFIWEKQFKKIMENGGFDVVIGNPPYGASFPEEQKTFISRRYDSYQYKFESYLYFFEKGIDLLKAGGYLSFITPELFLRLEKSENIRKVLYTKATLTELKFCGENVFQDVKVNSVITTLKKFDSKNRKKNSSFKISPEQGEPWQYLFEDWGRNPLLKVDYEVSSTVKGVIEKIDKLSTSVGKLGDAIQGLTPYDSYRGHSKELIKNRGFHFKEKIDDSCGKWLDGKNVNRYSLSEGEEWLRYGEWLAAAREARFFEGSRLLFREVPGQNKRIQATYVEATYYHGHSITPFVLTDRKNIDNLYMILGIVNSKLVSWYASYKSANFSKNTFPKLNPQDIKDLPVPKEEIIAPVKKRLIENVKSLLKQTEELSSVQQHFIDLLQSKFAITKLSGKIQEWYDLDYKEFLKELKKGKVTLRLSDESEWMVFFTEQKSKAKVLQSAIYNLDSELDKLVYKVYSLSPDEVKMIEG